MLEALWLSTASVVSAGETVRDETFLLNPGYSGGVQPGE